MQDIVEKQFPSNQSLKAKRVTETNIISLQLPTQIKIIFYSNDTAFHLFICQKEWKLNAKFFLLSNSE